MHRTTIAKYTKLSSEELKNSAKDPQSCVAVVQAMEYLGIRPRDCANIATGVRRCVTDRIGRYHSKVSGIILGYAKIRIENTLSAFRADSPYLHVRATIDYYVFQPRIGSTLRGTVNYVSKEFVSAMMYKVFNATVKLNKKPEFKINPGREISFIINACDMKSEIPIIDGELVLNNAVQAVGCKEDRASESYTKHQAEAVEKQNHSTHNEEDQLTQEDESTQSDQLVQEDHLAHEIKEIKQEKDVTKSKKKRKVREPEETNNTAVNGDHDLQNGSGESLEDGNDELLQSLFEDMFGNADEEPSASKMRKHKSKSESTSKKKPKLNGRTIESYMPVDSAEEGRSTASVSNGTLKRKKLRFDPNDTIKYVKSEPMEDDN